MPDAPLTTFAPTIAEPPNSIPTGNLWVSLPRIDRSTGAIRTLSVLHEDTRGMLEVWGDGVGVVLPYVEIDGVRQELADVTWTRAQNWLPQMAARCSSGDVEISYCAPVGERGVACRLSLRRSRPHTSRVTVGWRVTWQETALVQLRSKSLDVDICSDRDEWTGSQVLHGSVGLPLLAIGIQAGSGAELAADGLVCTVSSTPDTSTEDELAAELILAVAPERDGAAATALHLRRRGFDDLWASTASWLAEHELPVDAIDGRAGLHQRVNENAFFNYFYSQGDCLDTGRAVIVTSRSSDYYVSAAFWSRDAYQWTFPALLLVDPPRARHVLVTSVATAGKHVADHALYINGTPLYPGFELDQAAAPILAVHLYVTSTGDRGLLEEPAITQLCDEFATTVSPWRNDDLGLYATFLLPTDDPTRRPYTTTDNTLVLAAFEALAGFAEIRPRTAPDGLTPTFYTRLSDQLRRAIAAHLVVDGPRGPMWAWACDASGDKEVRDEPPLGLAGLPFWGLCDARDPRQQATDRWLDVDNPFHYDGTFPGSGSPHFPFPSGFHLAHDLLAAHRGGDPLARLVATPMDNGLGCESWHPDTGRVATGAAMASMGGLLTWTAWSRMTGRTTWHQALTLPGNLRERPVGP
jgi:hypothetical protein